MTFGSFIFICIFQIITLVSCIISFYNNNNQGIGKNSSILMDLTLIVNKEFISFAFIIST